jgi:nucleotide-binding universal stress UspA family protein
MATVSLSVAYDGSALSAKALSFATGLLKHSDLADPKAKVLHVTPNENKLLMVPEELKPEALKVAVKALAEESGAALEWTQAARGEDTSTAEALCKLVMEAKSDFICVGSTGRKDHNVTRARQQLLARTRPVDALWLVFGLFLSLSFCPPCLFFLAV